MQPWTTLIQYSLAQPQEKFVDLRQLLNNSNIIQSTVNEYWINVVRLWPISSNPITWNCITCFNFFSWLPCYSITPTSTHSPVLCKDLFSKIIHSSPPFKLTIFSLLFAPSEKWREAKLVPMSVFSSSPESAAHPKWCVWCVLIIRKMLREVYGIVCVFKHQQTNTIYSPRLFMAMAFNDHRRFNHHWSQTFLLLTIVVNVSCFC